MDKRKQILILVCLFLALNTTYAWPGEASYELDLRELDNRLESLQIYFESGRYEEASVLLEELIIEFPEEPRFRYLKAVVDYQREDYDDASKVFLEFIKQNPEIPEPYYLLSEINLKKGNFETARMYLTKYCRLAPEDYGAFDRLKSIANSTEFSNTDNTIVIRDGQNNPGLVKKIGFYGACLYAQQDESIKLTNGSHRSWSSMGIDFSYPQDLRKKQIMLKLKGKRGGENFELTFRDKFAQDYNPQLVLKPEQELSSDWREIRIGLKEQHSEIDLSQIVHIGVEFGFSTARNPANSVLFIKDIILEDADN